MRELFTAYWSFSKKLINDLADYGVNAGNAKVLLYLLEKEGLTQKELAENCFVVPATLTTVLSNMESNGLIERRRDEVDKRSYSIYPTPKGREVIEIVQKRLDDTIDTAFAGFSDEETNELKKYLQRVTGNLRNSI